jgi:hypothetical protein
MRAVRRRFDVLHEIERLDPERDHQRIVYPSRALLRAALKLRGRVVRWLPPRREPHFFTDSENRTYPRGYQISELGPPRLVAAERRRAQAHQET